jgi:hypothetical protein
MKNRRQISQFCLWTTSNLEQNMKEKGIIRLRVILWVVVK